MTYVKYWIVTKMQVIFITFLLLNKSFTIDFLLFSCAKYDFWSHAYQSLGKTKNQLHT